MYSRVQTPFAALALLCAAGGCGGGGGGSAPASFIVATPAPTPSPTPGGTPAITPSSLPELTSSGQTTAFTVAEPQYTGVFTALADPVSCAPGGNAVATVTPPTAPAASATFTVTTGTTAGVCTITVTDGFGQKAALSVTVTFTQGTLR